MNLEFFRQIFEKVLKDQIKLKSVLWELNCSMWMDGRTEGQTDMVKLIIAFRNYANAPKPGSPIAVVQWLLKYDLQTLPIKNLRGTNRSLGRKQATEDFDVHISYL